MKSSSRTARNQIPKWLEDLDDSWGIVWRVNNAIRNLDPVRFGRFLRAFAFGTGFHRPVFVIGTPRSGTSLLFEMLSRHPDLAGMGHEGHNIWRRFHHPRKTGWDSDVIDPNRALPALERRFAEAYIRARTHHKPAAGRLVEKTPDNTLRTDYVLRVFPDARFVSIVRDPCSVVSSYIDGWRDPDGRFRAYYVPVKLRIPGYAPERRWCSTLIPGWRELTDEPIPEIAFRQWETYVDAICQARADLGPEHLLEVRLEDLKERPEDTLRRVLSHLGLRVDETILADMVSLADTRVNAFSGHTARKWQEINGEEITALLPRISKTARKIGYHVDPNTGETCRQSTGVEDRQTT